MGRHLRSLATLWAIALVLVACPALGEDVDRSGAELLFDQGRQLMAEGDFAGACSKFEQSQALDPGIGTLLNLAACYERLGRTATAWTTYREAAAAARAAGQQDRAELARERAFALEPQLSRLTVRVARPVEGLEISMGGSKLSQPLWGQPVPVDPGQLVVEVLYPGADPWVREVEIPKGGGSVELEVPPPSVVSDVSAEPAAAGEGSQAIPADAGDADSGSGDGQRVAGWIVTGVGVAGLGVGSFFGLQAMSDHDASKEHCASDDPNFCEGDGVALREDAQASAAVSTIAFVAGAAAVAGGLVLVFTAPSSDSARRERQLVAAPAVGPTELGFVLKGAL